MDKKEFFSLKMYVPRYMFFLVNDDVFYCNRVRVLKVGEKLMLSTHRNQSKAFSIPLIFSVTSIR